MKGSLSVLLILAYFSSTSSFRQLAKLPMLFEHFKEHKAENSSMTIGKFLHLHYASSILNDEDHAKDEKLPFKTADTNSGAFGKTFTPQPFSSIFIKHVHHQAESFPVFDVAFPSSAFLSTIWQPPKSC